MQHPVNNQQNTPNSVFMESVTWLANIVAALIAWVVTPFIHAPTVGWAIEFQRKYYAPGLDEPVHFIWWIAIFLITFCLARMSISTLLISGGLALAVRFL